MKISASVPILTLNCKSSLERILPDLILSFDDVFIVDGNSTDGTQEYAKSLGVRMERQFDHDEPNSRITHFAKMRERSWSFARHDWIFWIDADEIPGAGLFDSVRQVVAENDQLSMHRFLRKTVLPDGRVVEYALYYPEYVPRLFHLQSGVHLRDRPVHERFEITENIAVVNHNEVILAPWSSPEDMWKRQKRYIELDSVGDQQTSWYLWRWILWFNLRSFAGQFVRMVIASFKGLIYGKTALPWSYSKYFLLYRLIRIQSGTINWLMKDS